MPRNVRSMVAVLCLSAVLLGCGAIGAPPARMGMVKNPETGLQIGSTVEKSLVTDASFYRNKKIKVRIRNTSGDVAFDLKAFTERLYDAYRQAGYLPADGDDFGLLVDVNVTYSGQIQSNLSREYAFLGATAGGIGGYVTDEGVGAAVGGASGATLGSIIGSYVTDDTYIVVATVTFGIVGRPSKTDGKSITFSRSRMGSKIDEAKREEQRTARGFRQSHETRVAVFAGGRNVVQAEIAGIVRDRLVRIVRDII
jgi:Enterobacterial TraT complement resistance protein